MTNSQNFLKTKCKPILAFFIVLIMACGPGFDPNQFWYFFNAQASTVPSTEDYSFIYKTTDYSWDYDPTGESNQPTDSSLILNEWANQLSKVPKSSIAKYIFEEENTKNTPAWLANYSEVKNYWSLAKQVQTIHFSPWEYTENDSVKYANAMPAIKELFENSQSAFLKKRFSFLYLKTLFHTENYTAAKEYYATVYNKLSGPSVLDVRARAYYAGTLLHTNQKHNAAAIYAQLFAQYPYMRKNCYQSVNNASISTPTKALDFCTTQQEKVNTLALLSLTTDYNSGDLLEQLLNTAPDHSLE
jgi:hypothetical protein